MNIIICNWKDRTHPGAGGAEVYTQECAARWAAWGHNVTLVCAAVEGQPASEVVDGVTVIRSGSRIGVYAQTARYLREHAAEADIVIDEINTRPFFAHRHSGQTPVVALVHQVAREVWFNEVPWPVAVAGRYLLEPRWLSKYENVPTLTVSESSAESLRAYGFRNIEIVPEGVEIDPEIQSALRGIPKASKPTLAFCGRLVSMKRPQDAIAAFVKAREILGQDIELHLVGGGPLEEKLRANATPGVVVHGRVSQLEKFRIMASAHALLATSVREGWGLVVSEAAAVGTPAIAYDIPGLRDSVSAANGVLSPENPDALAAAIVEHLPRLVAEPREALAHGGAHSWDTVAANVLEHLERVARRNPSARPGRTVPSSEAAVSVASTSGRAIDAKAARIATVSPGA